MSFDKHKKSQKLQLGKVTNYLQKSGFKNIKLEQQWRHITGKVTKKGISQFFKLASTQEVAEKTRNEFEWNMLINKSRIKNPSISVPQSYESGEYDGLFWFTSEFVDGNSLALVSQKERTKNLESNLEKIALAAKSILEVSTNKRLPNDKEESKDREGSHKIFLNRLKHWMKQFDENVDDLYAFIEKRMRFGQTAPSHGDFVPWHILITKDGKLFLIDGEHSKIEGIKFYDIAYFYHRVYTKLKRPDIADDFLKEFANIYSFNERDTENFRLILSQRVIGGYMDAKNDSRISVKLQNELKSRILEDGILQF